MSRSLDSGKALKWTDRLERFSRSGLTVARWCEAEGVSDASFYYWQKKVRDAAEGSREETTRSGRAKSRQQQRREASPTSTHRSSFQAVGIGSPAGELVRAESMIQHQATTIHFGDEVWIELGADLQVAEVVVKQVLDAASNNSLPRVGSPDGQRNGIASSRGAKRC